ncbi:MAG: adenylate/guanylate cyclase domain-containing protein [Thermoleophilaceae bacterium]|nr:adenylate/guanylate cyclase domain-containing protein [Thermoleophilaceae bacterium]
MAIDFEAEGMLDGVEDERSRQARLELLCGLEEQGFSLDELRRATAERRLALLPVERVLETEGPRYTQREICAETGLDFDFLAEARRAIGAPAVEPDERMLTEVDFNLARQAAVLLQSGLSREGFLELSRVMSQAMAKVAASFTSVLGQELLRPGDTERDLGLRYAETLRNLGPLAAPALGDMLNLRLREVIRSAVVGEAELRSGHLPGAQPVTVGFVDIVGFTQLGEEIPPEDLGELVRGFELSVERATQPPLRLVKTIGDAAMLVAPSPKPVVDAVVGLVERSREGEGRPLLRGGVASGAALQRAGDWYGRPVNLASRLTSFARRGSVVASKDVHDAVPDGYAWSFAGNRRFKGVGDEVPVYRVRPPEAG